jgi:4-amino-4-deoxy-L-arabinose transferase-like glycosyltransferase
VLGDRDVNGSYWLFGGALGLSALFLFAFLGSYPIALWDESRLAVNAMEMFLTGPGLVTTYNFSPDLWNTKPPLLIWLMTASMGLFGPSEWALRLPSALAALATVAIVMVFSWRLTHSAAAAVLACVLLIASRGFYGRHGAATGDYDALLTFFTTGYLYLLFYALHRRAPAPRRVIAAGALIAAATLTKGVAGLISGAGVVAYLLVVRRWKRPFLSPWYFAGAGLVVFAAASFYALREIAEPGYLRMVAQNDLTGRYLKTLGAHQHPFWHYVRLLVVVPTFSAGPLLVFLPFGLMAARGRVRLGIAFASCVAGAVVLIFSLSATKLPWYILPAYPFLAVGLALSASALTQRVLEAKRAWFATTRISLPQAHTVVLVLAAGFMAAASAYRYERVDREVGAWPQAYYGVVFADLHERGINAISVVDGGDRNEEGLAHYAPRLRFYQLLWQTRSFTVHEIAPDVATLSKRPGDVVVSCDPRQVPDLRQHGTPIPVAADGCISVQLNPLMDSRPGAESASR